MFSRQISLISTLLLFSWLVTGCAFLDTDVDVRADQSEENPVVIEEISIDIATDQIDQSNENDRNKITQNVTGDEAFNAVLLPKFMGISVFDKANEGAADAARSLRQPFPAFVGPTSSNSTQGQIEILNDAVTHGYDAVLISNNGGDEISAAAQAATEAGVTVITWDSPIPSAVGESVFVAQVDFDETGLVMAEMAHNILDGRGQIAILSAGRDAANQNAWIAAMETVLINDPKYQELEIVDTAYGNDNFSISYSTAINLANNYPDLDLIMAPTTVGIQAAAQAMQDEGLCQTVKTSGLGLPDEMVPHMIEGCVPQFALWSFNDLGYLAYYLAYHLTVGNIEPEVGETFFAGRLGRFTIEEDPTREQGLRVLMGSFTIYKEQDLLWQ